MTLWTYATTSKLIYTTVISAALCPTWESFLYWDKTGDYRQGQRWHRAAIWWKTAFPRPQRLQWDPDTYVNIKTNGRAQTCTVCVCSRVHQDTRSDIGRCFQRKVDGSHSRGGCESLQRCPASPKETRIKIHQISKQPQAKKKKRKRQSDKKKKWNYYHSTWGDKGVRWVGFYLLLDWCFGWLAATDWADTGVWSQTTKPLSHGLYWRLLQSLVCAQTPYLKSLKSAEKHKLWI